MKNKFKKFIEKLFCKHTYTYLGRSNNKCKVNGELHDVPIIYYECEKCKKRIVVKKDDYYYTSQMRQLIKLWKKHQIEIDFTEEKSK